MAKRKKKPVVADVAEVLPESPALPYMTNVTIEDSEIPVENPTLPPAEIKEPEDPRYTLLQESLKQAVDDSPSFTKVKDNPWLYLEWRNRIAGLTR